MEHELVQYSLGSTCSPVYIKGHAQSLKSKEVFTMKMFNGVQKSVAESVFEKKVKPQLKEKDGFIHVVMINSFSKFLNENFGCEDKYTNQIDEILTGMQMLGYEIIDIKFSVLQDQGMTKRFMEGFNTLIMYR